MPLAPGEVTRDQVIAYAASRGIAISKDQLILWHRNGLLPRPRSFPLGYGRGTVSAYPEVAQPLALFLARARGQRRSLDHMAFLAWVAGYPLTSRVRTLLTTRYREAANASTEALEAFERGDAENLIDDAIVGPPPAGFGRYRRAYRPTAVKIAMEAISGRFDPSLYDASDIGELLKQKNTSTRAAIDDVEKRVMSGVFGIVDRSAALDAVVRLSDRQLEADRDAAVTVWSNVEAKIGGPMLFGIFEAVFVARRVSAPCRLLLRLARRQGRERGFTTLATFYQHLRAEYDASNA